MNKLIYAIGIAVASTFAMSNKADIKTEVDSNSISKQEVPALPQKQKPDSTSIHLHEAENL